MYGLGRAGVEVSLPKTLDKIQKGKKYFDVVDWVHMSPASPIPRDSLWASTAGLSPSDLPAGGAGIPENCSPGKYDSAAVDASPGTYFS